MGKRTEQAARAGGQIQWKGGREREGKRGVMGYRAGCCTGEAQQDHNGVFDLPLDHTNTVLTGGYMFCLC